MEDRIIKYVLIIILLMMAWTMMKPALLDQKNLQTLVRNLNQQNQVIKSHSRDIEMLKLQATQPIRQ